MKIYGKEVVAGDLVLAPKPGCEEGRKPAKIVSEEDVANGIYSIDDVVLPLPGSHIQYPTNQIGLKYEEKLKVDGITCDHFHIQSLNVRLPGAYRRLVAHPHEIQWTLHNNYDEDTQPIINKSMCDDVECSEESRKRSRDLKLTFSLGPSCYGTVLLWECVELI
jgi:tRNA pseudouridine13 synthase